MLARKSCVLALLICVAASVPCALQAKASSRIPFRGQPLFLSGGNIAWIHFANDLDPGTHALATFDQIFRSVADHGGNTVRLWLHTDGTHTPHYTGDAVDGPGKNTIGALQKIVDDAWSHHVTLILCLWSFDMEKTTGQQLRRNRKLLTDRRYTEDYIHHALIPMVKGLQGHPGVQAWEIFNEPAGMSKQYGFDGVAVGARVTMHDIQRSVNLMAGAIHRTDPHAKVTNGSVSLIQNTDVDLASGDHNVNYYRDDRLIAAGGDPRGTLDFYTVHYYPWMGSSITPLLHDAAAWKLDKPLVIGEFFLEHNGVDQTAGVPTGQVYETYYRRGYAGALVWDWLDWHSGTKGLAQNWPLGLQNMDFMKAHHSGAVSIPP